MRISNKRTEQWQLSVGEEIKKVVEVAEREYPILTQYSDLEQLALFHKALGDETRLRIIGILLVQDACLCEIVDGLQTPTSTINHHLKILERGGVIHGRREGRFTVYAIDDTKLSRIPFVHHADNQPRGGNEDED